MTGRLGKHNDLADYDTRRSFSSEMVLTQCRGRTEATLLQGFKLFLEESRAIEASTAGIPSDCWLRSMGVALSLLLYCEQNSMVL